MVVMNTDPSVKKKILLAAGAFVLIAALICTAFGFWFAKAPCGTIVLAYHSINDVPFSESEHLFTRPSEFESQIKWLKKMGYEFIFADEFRQEKGKKLVCVTFDDGYKDNLTQALPILEKYQAKGTVFAATRSIGMNEYFLTEEDVRALGESPYMHLGSHTDGHYLATGLSDEDFERQLSVSQKRLEDLTGQPAKAFAYPGGYYDQQKAGIAAKYYDYSYIYPSTLWAATEKSPANALPRITVNRGTSGLKLLFMMRRAEPDPCYLSTEESHQGAK